MEKQEELLYEKQHLLDVRDWLNLYVKKQIKEEEKLEDKIFNMKKASKGSYNYELETTEKLYAVVKKNVSNYNEAKEQPYFARIDFREYRKEKESLYIGKYSLGDWDTGDEKVIDWRSPIADLYYSGTEGKVYYKAPGGVIDGELSLKRKFLFNDGILEDIFDESINDIILSNLGEEGTELIDEFLKINLEKSSGNKLKDIVATIQKEQNEIIRWDKNLPIIVQGAAGSGKTTVALHRLAYLLYRYKDSIVGENILVLAPNSIFLDYISDVLPNLGVDKVNQKTVEEFLLKVVGSRMNVITKDQKLTAIQEESEQNRKFIFNESKLKGSLLYKEILDRYIKTLEVNEAQIDDIKIDQWTLFQSNEIKRLFLKDLNNLPINKRKEEIKKYFSKKLGENIKKVIEKIELYYEYKINKVKKDIDDTIERRKELIKIYDERDELKKNTLKEGKVVFEDYFKQWINKDMRDQYKDFLCIDDNFEEITGNKIPLALWEYVKEKTLNNFSEGYIDADDCAAMAYLKLRIDGMPKMTEIKHVVIDEAQDYSPFQLYVISEIVSGKSMTIVGDLGQGIYYYRGINDWNNVINEVFKEKCSYKTLTQSYRSTIEIIEFANTVLSKQKLNLTPTKPVIRHGEKPELIKLDSEQDFIIRVNSIAEKIKSENKKSVAIVCRNFAQCKEADKVLKAKTSQFKWKMVKENDKSIKDDFIIIPAHLTKGLEFDCVIIYDANSESYTANEFDSKLLYVVLTRALHYEYIFYKGEITPLLK